MDYNPYISFHKYKSDKEKKKTIERNEHFRKEMLNKTIILLRRYFGHFPETSVYLFGSITTENRFTPYSDVDIAVSNYPDQRTELFCELEDLLDHKIDLVFLEKCSFRSDIEKYGIKIS